MSLISFCKQQKVISNSTARKMWGLANMTKKKRRAKCLRECILLRIHAVACLYC